MTTFRQDQAGDLWVVEEACRNAYPARELLIDGWLLRAAGGRSRRTNSVNPLRSGPRDPAPVIAIAEAIYAGRGQRTIFRVPDLASEMGRALDRHGYVMEGETRTLSMAVADLTGDAVEGVTLSHAPDARWLDAWARLNPEASAADGAAFRASTAAILLPAAYACRWIGDQPIALAYGMLDRGLMVVEAVVTEARHRRRGHAQAVLRALGLWAQRAGGVQACLQVAADNAPAQSLYRDIGFDQELYRYHYRVAPA